MRYVTGFFTFWYEFIVGDAWEVAAGVVVALVFGGLLARAQPALASALGPVLAIAVFGLLTISVWGERRRHP